MTIAALLFRLVNIALMIGIPVLLVIRFYRLGEGKFRPIWIGASAFILSQVGHIPFNQFIMLPLLKRGGITPGVSEWGPVLILGVAAGLSAGVFEEVTRFLVQKYWLREDHEEFLPLKYGIGHGGFEAILLGMVALAAFVQVMTLGSEGALSVFDSDQAELISSQIATYWEIPWHHSLLGAWERVSALAFHIGASLLVYKSVVEKNVGWLIIAILGHTAVDAMAVILPSRMSLILFEGILFVIAVGWFVWAWNIRARDPQFPEQREEPLPNVQIQPPDITTEQIEESRYDE
jgi:uncharacterized membrane protein YhfC